MASFSSEKANSLCSKQTRRGPRNFNHSRTKEVLEQRKFFDRDASGPQKKFLRSIIEGAVLSHVSAVFDTLHQSKYRGTSTNAATVTSTSRVRAQILREHHFIFTSIHHWTDSVTVRHWLQSAQKRQIVFVANRLDEILETSTIDELNHLPRVDSPADMGTRGMTIRDLNSNERIAGPAWLNHPESSRTRWI